MQIREAQSKTDMDYLDPVNFTPVDENSPENSNEMNSHNVSPENFVVANKKL